MAYEWLARECFGLPGVLRKSFTAVYYYGQMIHHEKVQLME
jgi:hypothetical protein